MKTLLLCLCITVVIFSSCKKDDGNSTPINNTNNNNLPFTPPKNSSTINFVKVGNSWDYVITDFLGSTINQTITVKSKVQNGVYIVESDIQGSKEELYWYIDGNFLYSYETDRGTSIRFKNNPKVGDMWSYTNTSNDIETTVMKTDTLIYSDTLKKSFRCHKYFLKLKNQFNDQVDYWSSDSGLVYTDADGLLTVELVKAKLN